MSSSTAASTVPSLAPTPARVVRSQAMQTTALDTAAKLERAKGRLYVAAQLGGWGLFLGAQLVFAQLFSTGGQGGRDALTDHSLYVMVVLMGLLLTHYARPFMARRGWKEMGWRALAPRVLVMSFVLSFLWSAVGYAYSYLLLQLPWTAKISVFGMILISTLNGAGLLFGWLCCYFFYHVFERLQRMQVEQLRLSATAKEAELRALNLTATAKEAELRALKSQVNPHFLFNSLNSLRALIDEDAPRAREAVTRLANMLRYSLQSGQLETVPLDDEVRIVEDYLALETIRHEARLRVRWNVSDEARARSVPPMLLQTLVENAVKYGISPRREGGEIVIEVLLAAGELRIRVTSPGNLSAPANSAAAKAGSSTGVGLRNAAERLKLLYGEQARLALSAESADRVAAEVTIPLAPATR